MESSPRNLYTIFYGKLPNSIEDLLPGRTTKMVTFLNPYYIECLKNRTDLYSKFDYICSDGFLPIWLNKFFCKQSRSFRISFDMTSLAKIVFDNIGQHRVYFIGSKQADMDSFINIISSSYPKMKICGYHHGYIKGQYDDIIIQILKSEPSVVIIGMGAPMQDEFAVLLNERGFRGTIYTCGGFFHQTTNNLNYYPNFINKFNLRWIYRMFKEPYVIKRVLFYYPIFIFHYSKFLLNMK